MTQTMLESKEDIIAVNERFKSELLPLYKLQAELENTELMWYKFDAQKRQEWEGDDNLRNKFKYCFQYLDSPEVKLEKDKIWNLVIEKRKKLFGFFHDSRESRDYFTAQMELKERWIKHGERLIKILDELPLISLKYSLSENYQALEFNDLMSSVAKVIPIVVECKINGSYVIKAENDIIKSVLENKTQKLGQPELRYLYGVSKSLWPGIYFEDDYYIFPKLSQEAVHNSSILIHIKDSRINHSWHGSIENAPFRIRLLYNAIQNILNSIIP